MSIDFKCVTDVTFEAQDWVAVNDLVKKLVGTHYVSRVHSRYSVEDTFKVEFSRVRDLD